MDICDFIPGKMCFDRKFWYSVICKKVYMNQACNKIMKNNIRIYKNIISINEKDNLWIIIIKNKIKLHIQTV